MNRRKNIKDHPNYFKLSHSESKVQEIKPVKIAELLGRSGQSQNSQKKSAVKIRLPERITPHLKNVSAQKKIGTNLYGQLNTGERNVRRNLNFTQTPISTTKTLLIKPRTNYLNKTQLNKEDFTRMASKRSFLVPPNTIKNSHTKIKSEQSRLSYLNQTKILTTDSENKNHRLSEKSRSCSSLAEDITMHKTNNKTSVIQHTSSWTLNLNDQSGINKSLSLSDFTKINNILIRGKTSNTNNINNRSQLCNNITTTEVSKLDVNKEQIRMNNELTNVNSLELAHDSTFVLGDAKNTKDKINLYSDTEMNETIFNRTEFIAWRSKLQSLVEKIEKDMSDMKLILNDPKIAKLGTITNQTISNNENKQQQTIAFLNDKTETVNYIEEKSLPCITTCENPENENILKDATETINLDLLIMSETDVDKEDIKMLYKNDIILETDKENQDIVNFSICAEHPEYKYETREHFMQLAANNLNAVNDSFVTLENELNINIKPNVITESLRNYTPLTNKYKDRKVNRPLKEYMALKSGMSCLLTPDIRQYQHLKINNNTNSDTAVTKAHLSTKVLADLSKLYSDSPDT